VDDIRDMYRQGLSITEIADLTGFDRKTVRKWLIQPGPPHYGPRAPRPGKLDPYKPYINQRMSAGVWNAAVLLRELRDRMARAPARPLPHPGGELRSPAAPPPAPPSW